MKKNQITLLVIIVFGIGLGVGAYMVLQSRSMDAESQIINIKTANEGSTPYTNNQYNFYLILPSGWTVEELPIFIEGVMTYTGRNLSFTNKRNQNVSLGLIVHNNEISDITSEQYVDGVLEENEKFYNLDKVPYKWEFDQKYEIVFEKITGYVLENLKGPGGYRDLIYIVGKEFVYEFSHSYVDENGLSRVNNELRGQIKVILDTLTIN